MLNLSAFSEAMLVHEHACVRIDPDMPLDRAAVIGCAVTTGAGTIFNAGATPVFVDVDEKTLNLDAEDLDRKATPRSKASVTSAPPRLTARPPSSSTASRGVGSPPSCSGQTGMRTCRPARAATRWGE